MNETEIIKSAKDNLKVTREQQKKVKASRKEYREKYLLNYYHSTIDEMH